MCFSFLKHQNKVQRVHKHNKSKVKYKVLLKIPLKTKVKAASGMIKGCNF